MKMESRKKLAERISTYRIAHDWSQAQMAAIVGICTRTIVRAESGKGYLGPRTRYKIEKLIG
jgi:DNA-binding XRE family transcriptional regulator